VKRVPPGLLRLVARGLDVLSLVLPRLAEKAEYARIGHYYATESMLVWNEETQRYDADATPSWGQDWLEEHYRNLLLSVGSNSS
jgi:divinyl chlorophyllide a 8-vinyl-reductase